MAVWLDCWDIIPGDEISQAIEHGLEDSEFVVIMLSENSVNSGWVDKEWRTKLNEELTAKEVKVICVRLDDCAVPTLLKGKKFINAFEDGSNAAEELLAAIAAHQSRRTFRPWIEAAKRSAEATGKHTPSALIRIRDSVVSVRDNISSSQAVKLLASETDFVHMECHRNVAFSEERDYIRKGEDGITMVVNMIGEIAKQNAEANLREVEAWKRLLSFYLDRPEIDPDTAVIHLLAKLDKFIEEFTSK
jgi:hypothetical protein